MKTDDEKLRRLSSALEDHSAEGIEILYSEPSKIMRMTILLILLFLFAALVWSFFGRADVIVTATGVLSPDEEVRRVYTPIGGELVEIFVTEGVPVSKGDVLARLNARDAIQAAAKALEAELTLSEVKQEYEQFPARRKLMERRTDAMLKQIETAERLQEKRVTEGLEKLAQAQRSRLEETRGNLEKAGIARDAAKREWEKFKRLFARPGGGGVSKNKVEEKRDLYRASETDYRLAEAKLGELEFQLSQEYEESKADLEGSDQKLAELRIEYEKALNEIEQEIHKAEVAGAEAFPGFDSTDFRQACDYVDDTPNIDILARDLNDRLNQEQKVAVIAYLKAIAESDGNVDWAEQDFIDAVAAALGVEAA